MTEETQEQQNLSPQEQTTPMNHAALQNMYPPVSDAAGPPQKISTVDPQHTERYKAASVSLDEALSLILGLMAALSHMFLLYMLKSIWIAMITSALFAALAIFFVFKGYRISQRVSPITVIALCVSTTTLLAITNLLVLQTSILSVFW